MPNDKYNFLRGCLDKSPAELYLSLYVHERLDPEQRILTDFERELIESHLGKCEPCSKRFKEFSSPNAGKINIRPVEEYLETLSETEVEH